MSDGKLFGKEDVRDAIQQVPIPNMKISTSTENDYSSKLSTKLSDDIVTEPCDWAEKSKNR